MTRWSRVLCSAFFWVCSMCAVSLVWLAVPALHQSLFVSLLLAVGSQVPKSHCCLVCFDFSKLTKRVLDVQEIFRYGYYVVCKSAERRLGMCAGFVPVRALTDTGTDHGRVNHSSPDVAETLLRRRPFRHPRSRSVQTAAAAAAAATNTTTTTATTIHMLLLAQGHTGGAVGEA